MRIEHRRETIETVNFQSHGRECVAEFYARTQYDEEGNMVPHYDGAPEWYYVQLTVDGIPEALKAYGPNIRSAQALMSRIRRKGRW